MPSAFKQLIEAFDRALAAKEAGRFGADEVNQIYEKAKSAFDGHETISPQQLMQIRDKFVELSGGAIRKGAAMAKLQTPSGAESMKAVLSHCY